MSGIQSWGARGSSARATPRNSSCGIAAQRVHNWSRLHSHSDILDERNPTEPPVLQLASRCSIESIFGTSCQEPRHVSNISGDSSGAGATDACGSDLVSSLITSLTGRSRSGSPGESIRYLGVGNWGTRDWSILLDTGPGAAAGVSRSRLTRSPGTGATNRRLGRVSASQQRVTFWNLSSHRRCLSSLRGRAEQPVERDTCCRTPRLWPSHTLERSAYPQMNS